MPSLDFNLDELDMLPAPTRNTLYLVRYYAPVPDANEYTAYVDVTIATLTTRADVLEFLDLISKHEVVSSNSMWVTVIWPDPNITVPAHLFINQH